MKALKKYQFWFCTGSQDLYGDECLRKVAAHSREVIHQSTTTPIAATTPLGIVAAIDQYCFLQQLSQHVLQYAALRSS